jgi:tetratricopeptide (TPR) repeat protein
VHGFASLPIIAMQQRSSRTTSTSFVRQGLADEDNNNNNNNNNNNKHRIRPSTNSNNFECIEDVPLNQIFQKAVVLQRMGDRTGCLAEYERFITMAQSHDVHPSLYAEVYANIGAIYAMQASASSSTDVNKITRKELREKAKYSFQEAVKYRPSLCSAYVNLSLLLLSEGKELGNTPSEQIQVKELLREARQCCERALGLDNDVDERSRSLAYKLIGDIDKLMKQQR